MAEDKDLALILDFGVALFQSGAETHRVEDSLYRLAAAFGFVRCNIWVIPSNIQATVTAPDGAIMTQIRHIRRGGVDFARLDELNALSRQVCSQAMDSGCFAVCLAQIMDSPPAPAWLVYLSAALAGAGFGVFFNCGARDAAAAACTSLLVAFLIRTVGARQSNPLIVNFIISCLSEAFILLSVKTGFGEHAGPIAAGVVMMLISGLGVTNGVRDLVHQDTLSGLLNIVLSLVGAGGIALGIALPLRLFGAGASGLMSLNPQPGLQMIAAAVGCLGFALWFHVKIRHLSGCVLGAMVTWSAYLGASAASGSEYWGALASSAVCAALALLLSRAQKSPVTIFQTVAIFPVIPGAALYAMMYGFIMGDAELAAQKGSSLALTCLGIVLGFMLVEMLFRTAWPQAPESKEEKGGPSCR